MIRYKFSKPDANQATLVSYLRALGASFAHTHTIPGALDGIVGCAGIDQRVEIKDSTKPPSAKRLTDLEQKTFDEWKGRPPVVIETKEDCETLINTLRREAFILKSR